MKQIPVNQIKEGDCLGIEVRDDRGNVLLPAGSKLTANHVRLLARREIASVYIQTPEDVATDVAAPDGATTAGSPEADAAKAARLARVERIFAAVADDPIMRELRRLALARAEQGALGD